MRTLRFSKFFLLLLSVTFVTSFLPAFGQEESSAPAAEENAGLTQGQAAMIIARRLGLFNSAAAAPTQASAIQLLSARGISPKAGWEADELLDPGLLARLLVQALGLESELTDDQIAGDDPQPYIDVLIEKYGVDVTEIASGSELADTVPGSTGIVDPVKEGSIDPLLVPPLTGGNNNDFIPVSQQELDATLDAIVGGGASSSNNMTPSAP